MKVTITTNYSKLNFVVDRINVEIAEGLSLYGVEVCKSKAGKLYLRHGHSYQKKDGTYGDQNYTFIGENFRNAIIAEYTAVKNAANTQPTIPAV